ncbi:MAG: hypothetical protein IPK28_18895 [Devosia sp.]|nr:hypothetical protein [Devosia sp.]
MSRATLALVAVGLFSVAVNLLLLTGPIFMMLVYDRVLTSRSVATLVVLVVLVGVLLSFLALFDLVRRQILGRLGNRLELVLSDPIFESWIKQNVGRPGHAQPLEDLKGIRQFLSSAAPLALFDLPWTLLFLWLIFLFHSYLGYVALTGAAFLTGLALLTHALTRRLLANAARDAAKAAELVAEARRGAEAAVARGMVRGLMSRWRTRYEASVFDQSSAGDTISLLSAVARALRLFLQSAILAVGAWLAILQEVTPGTMIAASILMGRVNRPGFAGGSNS